ncbi:nucleotidyltransferase domain-containing protein [Candidatus Woesearchaeota archaeon]|nr:nucleotidyltransferase domain-containing protein [Candidatus Woesearchaeota archaeon]
MKLLNFLANNSDIRRIFGERELKIIEKQLWGINLTQSEKNRLSRDIRKKFDLVGKMAHLSNEFELKKGGAIKEIINESKEVILNDNLAKYIKRIILYGSVVENKITPKSDIDLAVEFDKINLKEATKFRIRISGNVSEKADIQVFNILPQKLKDAINRYSKVIFER